MKEKFKNILKFLMSKKVLKSFIIIVISIILFYTSFFLYSYFFESEKLEIDNYNFNQLKQVKEKFKSLNVKYGTYKIDWLKKTTMYYESGGYKHIKFYNLGDFNRQYNLNIKPLKNCYYFAVSSLYGGNGKYPYIFGFQLESTFYKILNFGKYYSYPGYDLNHNLMRSTGFEPHVNSSLQTTQKIDTNLCTGNEKIQDLMIKYGKMSRDEKFIYKVSNTCTCLDFYDRDK